MRWLYPEDEIFFQPGGVVIQPAMIGWLTNQQVWCTDDGVAHAVWFPPVLSAEPARVEPPAPASAAPTGPIQDPPPPPFSAELLARFEQIGPLMRANKPPEAHWYLQLLATHPDWQRQGLGGELMEVVFEQADATGLPCYLETETPENVAYYRRHGFEVRSEWDVDPEGVTGAVGPHMWGMLRPPR